MLALFTELLNSTKLSEPRLLLNLKPQPVRKKSTRRQSAKTSGNAQADDVEQKSAESEQNLVAEKATTLQSLGIISTDQGLQYHPESIPKRKPRKSRSSKPSESSPKKVKKTQKDTSRAAKQKELEETRTALKQKTPCRFYQRGRCLKADCPFLHEGPPPLCYNILKLGKCEVSDCIYNHDPKTMGCIFFHVLHNCARGDDCRFSHDPISEEALENLRRVHEEVEMEKKSTMPAELAKALLSTENSSTAGQETSENNTSLSTDPSLDKPTFEDIPTFSVVPANENQRDSTSPRKEECQQVKDVREENGGGDGDDKEDMGEEEEEDLFF